jgi:hypothetical protein
MQTDRPRASGSRATARLVGINLSLVILFSVLCMPIHGMSMFTEPVFFYRGQHGQESEEGKEDREGSHQEGGKEDFEEKEVVVSTTGTLRLRVATRTHSKTFPKGLNVLCSRSVPRQRKTRPDLCADGDCIKVRLFRFCPMGMICCCARNRKPHGRDAPRLTRARSGPCWTRKRKTRPAVEGPELSRECCLRGLDHDLKHRNRLFNTSPPVRPQFRGGKFRRPSAIHSARNL